MKIIHPTSIEHSHKLHEDDKMGLVIYSNDPERTNYKHLMPVEEEYIRMKMLEKNLHSNE